MSTEKKSTGATLLAKAGHFLDPTTGGIVPPLHTSSTYARDADYQLRDHRLYGRDNNPGFEQAESILCQLEQGADAALFSSGMAAASALIATLSSTDQVVVSGQCYFGVRHWLEREAERVGFGLRNFVAGDLDDLAKTLSEGPASLVWVESPANPTWEVTDIEVAATLAHQAGARLLVDATVMTPLICQPIALGADYVMHSATKYLNGHSDVVAGALVCARDDEHWQAIKQVRYHAGAILGTFEAWLLIRGLRTLHLRLRQACQSALAIAVHFDRHPAVKQVLYPGLDQHPGHAIANRQWNTDVGYTGMLSLRLAAGEAAARALTLGTRLFVPATSLGGIESLIEHRRAVEGPQSTVPVDLVRISVGIEDTDELITDLDAAIAGSSTSGNNKLTSD